MAAVSESNFDRALLFRLRWADARAAGLCSGKPRVFWRSWQAEAEGAIGAW